MEDRRGILNPEAAEKHFRLTRFLPSDDLADLVERHWSVEWDLATPFTQEIVTHPSVNIAFESGRGTIHGVVTKRFRRELTGTGYAIATKFRPAGFHPFHPVPAYTLTDKILPVDAVFKDFAPQTHEEIEERLRSHGYEDDPRVQEINELHARILEDPTITRVEQLATAAGYSKRTLQRLFREYVGVTPKWVLERIRLHEAAERMTQGDQDWPALALDLGYFDQAHFIKAFKAVVGRSPADYALTASASVG